MTQTGYAPQSFYSLDRDIKELEEEFGVATSIKEYYSQAETEQRRDEFIAGRLTLYNLEYLRFVQGFRLGRAEADTIFDSVLLGLGLATTLSSGERTKTVLGAITTAFTGSRNSVEKNFYADKTTSALVAQMNADRKVALIPILAGTQEGIEDYPLSRAIVDLSEYQFAGTIDGALQGVQKDAAVKDVAASKDIEQYRSVAFSPDDSTARIRKYLYPQLSKIVNGKMLDANGVVIPSPVQARVTELLEQKNKLGYGDVAIGTFLNGPDFAEARAQIVKNLDIP